MQEDQVTDLHKIQLFLSHNINVEIKYFQVYITLLTLTKGMIKMILPLLDPKTLFTKDEIRQELSMIKHRNDTDIFSVRQLYTTELAWFLLTKDVVELLIPFIENKYVIEVCAGSGYLQSHLSPYTTSYRAYDNKTTCSIKTLPHANVKKKNARLTPIKNADVIVLTWPNYKANVAYKIIRKMVTGQVLIFNGEEWEGLTADDAFFEYLHTNFKECVDVNRKLYDSHIRFIGINDNWSIYIKQ